MKKFMYAWLFGDKEERVTTWTLENQEGRTVLENLTNEKLLQVLNALGEDGWEAVSVDSSPTRVLLKKEFNLLPL